MHLARLRDVVLLPFYLTVILTVWTTLDDAQQLSNQVQRSPK